MGLRSIPAQSCQSVLKRNIFGQGCECESDSREPLRCSESKAKEIMNNFRPPLVSPIVVAGLLCCLAGCQQWGSRATSGWNRLAHQPPKYSSPLAVETPKPTPAQKLNLRLSSARALERLGQREQAIA